MGRIEVSQAYVQQTPVTPVKQNEQQQRFRVEESVRALPLLSQPRPGPQPEPEPREQVQPPRARPEPRPSALPATTRVSQANVCFQQQTTIILASTERERMFLPLGCQFWLAMMLESRRARSELQLGPQSRTNRHPASPIRPWTCACARERFQLAE
jgi:hypothetical protein